MNKYKYKIFTTDKQFTVKADGFVDWYDTIQFYNIVQEERYLGFFEGTRKEKREYIAVYIKKYVIGFEKVQE